MGGGNSVEFFANARSITVPGQKCLMSSSLDDLSPAVPPQNLIAALVEYLTRPVDLTAEILVKDVRITEHDGLNDFTVKVIFDGEVLDASGFGRGDGTDRVRKWKRVKVDQGKWSLNWVDHVPEEGAGKWIDEAKEEGGQSVTVTILSDPSRIEVVILEPTGDYLSDEKLKQGMHALFANLISQAQLSLQDVVKAQVGPAIKHSGEQSVIVEDMDKHVKYNDFFDFYVNILREGFAGAPSLVLEEPKDGEFSAFNMDNRITHVVTFNMETGEISQRKEDPLHNILTSTHWQIYKRPLVLEAWSIDESGARVAGPLLVRNVHRAANASIARSKGWFTKLGFRRSMCAVRSAVLDE
uniref:Uncharacterized protein n=1 Tax=Zooxanthella nutricula TaxID=1333877 RepID=A0A6U6UPX8_9DINO